MSVYKNFQKIKWYLWNWQGVPTMWRQPSWYTTPIPLPGQIDGVLSLFGQSQHSLALIRRRTTTDVTTILYLYIFFFASTSTLFYIFFQRTKGSVVNFHCWIFFSLCFSEQVFSVRFHSCKSSYALYDTSDNSMFNLFLISTLRKGFSQNCLNK